MNCIKLSQTLSKARSNPHHADDDQELLIGFIDGLCGDKPFEQDSKMKKIGILIGLNCRKNKIKK